MKRNLVKIAAIFAVVIVTFTGCSNDEQDNVITVGASSVPHAEILEFARDQIEDVGYELEIQIFDDYVLPNKALENGDIDANYFQHIPYLEEQEAEFGYDFEVAAKVHVEPINIFSKKYTSVDQIEEGSTILMSNSVSDQARVLTILEQNGLIELKEGVDSTLATFDDIVSNPLNLQFDADYDPSILAKVYENGEGDLVAINTNYALSNEVDFSETIMSESSDSDYANVLVVRSEDVDSEKTKVLIDALTSGETKAFINENYGGAVVAANN